MKTKIALLCVVSLIFALSSNRSAANPVGGTVVGGGANATITGQGTSLTTINQTANNVVINWQDFSIGAGEVTRFVQPSATASALNRVISGNPSEIYGSLQANGRVFVINPNGILVGSGGQIDTKGFVASTLDLSDSSFMAGGNLVFSGDSVAGIRNEGVINALGGDVFLIAHTVENAGTIRAPQGTVGLAAGSQVQLVQSGNERISVLAGNPNAPTADAGVNNSGTIEAVSAELKAAGGNIYALAINNGGVVRATGIRRENGRIYLTADGGNIENSGTLSAHNANGSGGKIILDGGHNADAPSAVTSSGTIEARGNRTGAKGGIVNILGDHVGLLDNALVDVSGDRGGGTALIGGDYQGANPAIQNATMTTVDSGAQIRADALHNGDAGKVIVWADDTTVFNGTIYARALGGAGRGGFAEISGQQHMLINGHAYLGGAKGQRGQLFLDPGSVLIINDKEQNTPPAADLDVFADSWIVNQLNTGGADVTISTAYSQNGNAEDLTVRNGANVSWNSANSLTLIGNNSLTTQSGSTIANLGTGSLSLQSGAGSVTLGGGINMAGNLDINAAGAVAFNGATTVGGDLNVTAGGSISQTASIMANGAGRTATFMAGLESSIILNYGNDFNTVVINRAWNAEVYDVNHINLGNLTVIRNLRVNAGSVDFTGAGRSTVGGTLDISTWNGGISDSGSGSLTVLGVTTLSARFGEYRVINDDGAAAAALGNDILLNNHANDFSTVTINQGGNVSIWDANNIVFSGSDISADMLVVAGGDVHFDTSSIGGHLALFAGNLIFVDPFTLGNVLGGITLVPLGGTPQKTKAARSVVASVYIPLPRLDSANFSDSSLGGADPAQFLPPGSIGTLWLQLPFPPKEMQNYRIEDVSKWAGGPFAVAGMTSGSVGGQ